MAKGARLFADLDDEEKFALLLPLIEQGDLDLQLNVTPLGEEHIYSAFDYHLLMPEAEAQP